MGDTILVSAGVETDLLVKAVRETLPASTIIGRGEHVAVMKSVGHPMDIAAEHRPEAMSGSQSLSHTRMATESAVTAGCSHPFSVADDLCLVHNDSGHVTIAGMPASGLPKTVASLGADCIEKPMKTDGTDRHGTLTTSASTIRRRTSKDNPGHHRWHGLRRAVRQRPGSPGARRQRSGHLHDNGRRRHDA